MIPGRQGLRNAIAGTSAWPAPCSLTTSRAAATGDQTAQGNLDATLGERGLKGAATTRLIAERAGVNEVTPFRKLGNKMSLVGEAIQHRFAADAVVCSGTGAEGYPRTLCAADARVWVVCRHWCGGVVCSRSWWFSS